MAQAQAKTFRSDFYLKPLNYKTKSGLATWHADTDPAVHDLIDGYRTEPVCYTRRHRFNGKYQDCKVVRELKKSEGEDAKTQEYNIILLPGDGTRYSVTRVSTNNKIKDAKAEDDTYRCVICQDYAQNHAAIPCGHLITCARCTQKMEDQEKRCPVCQVPYDHLLRIFSLPQIS